MRRLKIVYLHDLKTKYFDIFVSKMKEHNLSKI